MSASKPSLFRVFRIAFAAVILIFLLASVGTTQLILVLAQLRFDYIAMLIALSAVMIWVSCLKWQLFLRRFGHNPSLGYLMKLYTLGYFFSSFLPSFLGGDAVRSFHLGRELTNQRDAFISTFLERLTGLLAMCLLGLFFVLIGTKATAGVEVAIVIVALSTIAFAGVCFSTTLSRYCNNCGVSFFQKMGVPRVSEKLLVLSRNIEEGMDNIRGDFALLLRAMLLSFAYHSLTVANTYLCARAIGWESPDIGGLFVIVPLVLLVSIIPLTPSGLGVQEGAFLFFLERIGATRTQGLAVGLLLRAKVLFIALCGGLLWAGMRRVRKVYS